MKYIISLCLFAVCIMLSHVNAQVGINTVSPQGVFHIDAGIVNNTDDDLIIDNQGRIGIGTIPSAKLHIVNHNAAARSIKIVDGSQANNKMLISDADGIASWKTQGIPLVKGILSPTGLTANVEGGLAAQDPTGTFADEKKFLLHDLGGTITLPPGRWSVFCNLLAITTNPSATDNNLSTTWMRLGLSERAGGNYTGNVVDSYWISGNLFAFSTSVIQGFIIIKNKDTTTYHLGIAYADQNKLSATVRLVNFGIASQIENTFFALKIADN